MSIEWGVRQEATIGKKWISVEETATIEPNVVYEFNFTVPKVPWYITLPLGYSFEPGKFAISFKDGIAEQTGIPSEEIDILWQNYSPEANFFRMQIKYSPLTEPAEGVPPAGLITILVVVTVVGLVFRYCFAEPIIEILELLHIDITPNLVEIKKLIAEAVKGLPWIAIPVSILGIGWIVSMFVKKKGG